MTAIVADPESVFDDVVATEESGGTITTADIAETKAALERMRAPQEGFINVPDTDIAAAHQKLENFRNILTSMANGNPSASPSYDVTVVLHSKNGAFQTAEAIQEIYTLLHQHKDILGEKVSFRVITPDATKGKEITEAGRYARQHKGQSFSLPVLSEEKTTLALQQLEQLTELRAAAGQKISLALPDGLKTDPEVAALIANKVNELTKKYPGTFNLKSGKAQIENPESSFHRHFTKKRYQTQLTSEMSGEEINAAIDKLAKTRKESLDNGTKSRPRFSLHLGKGLKLLDQMKSKIVNLWNDHLHDARVRPAYNKSNFVITGEGSQELMREKTTDEIFEELAVDSLLNNT